MRLLPIALMLSLSACVLDEGPAVGSRQQSIAHAGPWQIPTDVLTAGDSITSIGYVGAGPYNGGAGCSGGMEPGTVALREYLYKWFPATYEIGGYNCRPIAGTGTLSLHGTGRALDIMIPLAGPYADDNAADNDLGDPIGNWLIENAEQIGIQLIIWDQWSWGPHRDAGAKERSYGGAHPHHDHLHVELTPEAAALGTRFFQGEPAPPELPACPPIPASGAIIDDVDACVQFFGPADYWRTESGRGHGGSLRWTNAFESASESNWARYILDFEEAGEFDVSVFLDPEFSVHRETRYVVTHADGATEVVLDQSAGQGWTSLGRFTFEAGTHQDVMVFDNSSGPVGDEQHITVDALRIGEGEDEGSQGKLSGGCRAGGRHSSGHLALLLVVLLLASRGRRRSRR